MSVPTVTKPNGLEIPEPIGDGEGVRSVSERMKATGSS